jgi:hypothetical protein
LPKSRASCDTETQRASVVIQAPTIAHMTINEDKRRSKYPPAKPGALDQEPLKAAIVASHVVLDILVHRKFTGWEQLVSVPSPLARSQNAHYSPRPSCARVASISLSTRASDQTAHNPAQARRTPGNVKLLLPPRQSRGNSHYIRLPFCSECTGRAHRAQ